MIQNLKEKNLAVQYVKYLIFHHINYIFENISYGHCKNCFGEIGRLTLCIEGENCRRRKSYQELFLADHLLNSNHS